MIQTQDPRRQQPAKRTRQRRHDDIQRQPKRQLRPAIPPRHVIRNPRQHARLKHPQQEPDASRLREIVHKRCRERDDAEGERDGGNVPAWAYPLAHDVGGDLEHNVGDVEDGEEGVVVVALEAELLFEAGDFGIS